jgi:hypothetical protein
MLPLQWALRSKPVNSELVHGGHWRFCFAEKEVRLGLTQGPKPALFLPFGSDPPHQAQRLENVGALKCC